jgi:hypothetical protein
VLVLFDHGTPKGLARALSEHAVNTVQSRGWGRLSNGELLNAAEQAGFEVLLTTDRRIRYQQNLNVRRIALVVLTGSTKWTLVRHHAERIAAAVLPRLLAAMPRSRFHSTRGDKSGSIQICGWPCGGRKSSMNTRERLLVSLRFTSWNQLGG